jgi:hypothetical protein
MFVSEDQPTLSTDAKDEALNQYISEMSTEEFEKILQSRRIKQEYKRMSEYMASTDLLPKTLDISKIKVIHIGPSREESIGVEIVFGDAKDFFNDYEIGNNHSKLEVGGTDEAFHTSTLISDHGASQWFHHMEALYYKGETEKHGETADAGIEREVRKDGENGDSCIEREVVAEETYHTSDSGLFDIMIEVAGDLGLDVEVNKENIVRGLLELFWGTSLPNRRIPAGEHEDSALWELVLPK